MPSCAWKGGGGGGGETDYRGIVSLYFNDRQEVVESQTPNSRRLLLAQLRARGMAFTRAHIKLLSRVCQLLPSSFLSRSSGRPAGILLLRQTHHHSKLFAARSPVFWQVLSGSIKEISAAHSIASSRRGIRSTARAPEGLMEDLEKQLGGFSLEPTVRYAGAPGPLA